MDGTSPRVTTIFTERGAEPWKRLSARTEEFLAKYPLADGWRVLSSYQYVLDVSPGLLKVAEVAAAANADLTSYGLTVADLRSVIFKASLVDSNGTVLREASSHKVVAATKDWEVGESVAYGRLLAKLGFGGDILDSDENADFASQNITYQDAPPKKQPESASDPNTPQKAKETASAEPEKAKSKPAKGQTKPSGPQPPQLSKQIKLLLARKQMKAAELGITLPEREIASDADAKAFAAEIDEAIKAAGKAEASS